MARYLVATRRHVRGTAPSARDAVAAEPGIEVVDGNDPDVITIETTPERAAQLRAKLDATHIVEPEVRRDLH